ncbi:MAG: permease-like cell division protein FtsX [Candidatus Saccharimonadales bacterium]
MSMQRKLTTLRRIFKSGVVNLGRNLSLAIAAIVVMVVTLTGVLMSVVVGAAFNNTITQLTDKIDISMYIADNAPQATVDTLVGQLQQRTDIQKAEFISKEQALATYREEQNENEGLQEAISQTDNPLPASIHIKPVDPSNIQPIIDFLNNSTNVKLQDVAGISYQGERKQAIDNITHATDVLRRIGIITVIVFAIVSVLIIFNTIQMAIFNRRDELTIMRLLGASTSFIRGPFIVESVLYGVIAAVISVLLVNSLFLLSSSTLQASSLGLLDIEYAATYFKDHFWVILLMELGVGILIGAASSIVATRRYLKFKTK